MTYQLHNAEHGYTLPQYVRLEQFCQKELRFIRPCMYRMLKTALVHCCSAFKEHYMQLWVVAVLEKRTIDPCV